MLFKKVLDKSNAISRQKWVNKGSEFYKQPMKLWLQKNAVEIY